MKIDFIDDWNPVRDGALTEDHVVFLIHGNEPVNRGFDRAGSEELDEILKSRLEHFGCDRFGKSYRATFTCGDDF